jgi:GTP pyrophosphokinase
MDQQLMWVRHLLENQADLKNPKEFLHAFKVNLFPHEVYVFTPDGDVISLPHGSTPVDFAYAVHTDIGHHCTTAKVDGKAVPLRHKLKNGNRVEIITTKRKSPSRDWLAFVKTSRARSKIANFINSHEREQSKSLGRELLEKEIKECGFQPPAVLKGKALEETIQACGYNSLDNLMTAIGMGKVSVYHALEKLLPKETLEARKLRDATPVKLKEKTKPPRENAIKVQCLNDNILMRMGKCCNPVPGDPIIGYITRGRGLTIHHIDCPGVVDTGSESERLIHVEWDTGEKTIYPARVYIVGQDEPGMLANISAVLAKCDINIIRANVQQGSHKRAYFDLSIEIHDVEQLNATLEKVRKVPGVIHLERVKEYKRKTPGGDRLEDLEPRPDALEDQELLVN